jgi:hypothetical protein
VKLSLWRLDGKGRMLCRAEKPMSNREARGGQPFPYAMPSEAGQLGLNFGRGEGVGEVAIYTRTFGHHQFQVSCINAGEAENIKEVSLK